MKRIKIGLFILSLILDIGIVKADTIISQSINNTATNINSETLNYIYNNLIPQHSNYHYFIEYLENSYVTVYFFDYFSSLEFDNSNNYLTIEIEPRFDSSATFTECYKDLSSGTFNCDNYSSRSVNILLNNANNNTNYYTYYDSNINITNDIQSVKLTGFYQDDILIEMNSTFPKFKDLLQYNSWSDYENNHLENYTTVNLNNYEYVLLSLKDYNQTDAFQTNLQVKGQIGITPIYNYGQTSKDSITGAQVQDRCNVNYENYTSYPFYIIQSDLQNNVIYAVKECSQDSSFKFDNTIFDITYVTAENKDNPTITIDGKTYNVIPYEDLPSTATKNEEDNYIPGESGSATDTGGLDSAIKSVQQRMSEIWNTFTYFTSFVGQIFSSMPSEVQTVLLSAFTIAIVLGLIKIFIN